ncbi:MAG: nucleotidyl transferase AbiEii/AbiGii toxin family protein [Nitrospinae bacterium]|nr:nucleotidyl transferase AbiEii/AbiGii toxin family protein [Nitrospinota bacterium]
MVVGSMAVMVYGEPRMTHDLDLVVDIPPQDAEKIETLFPAGEFYCPPLEFLRSEIVRQGQFNLIHNESGLKIDVIIRKQTDHAICEFGRKRKVPFWQGSEVYIASAEDIVIKKLEFFRLGGSEKHIRDIRGILAETEVDAAYLQEWVSRLGLAEQWLKVNAN